MDAVPSAANAVLDGAPGINVSLGVGLQRNQAPLSWNWLSDQYRLSEIALDIRALLAIGATVGSEGLPDRGKLIAASAV